MQFIVGHLVGDILFQNRWLAFKKRESIWGMCLHCLIVTFFVVLFAGWLDYRALLAFVSHFVIDYFQLKKRWPRWIGQTNSDWTGPLDDQVFHLASLTLIGAV